jgi:hypothetical protein
MKLVDSIDRASLASEKPLAESNEFAIYEAGNDAFTLVHRHEGVQWQGITISGDALFRIAELIAAATRSLYRDVAGDLSRSRNRTDEEPSVR